MENLQSRDTSYIDNCLRGDFPHFGKISFHFLMGGLTTHAAPGQ
ncbi:unnamed protein product [Staurois parvus]|uniref:Uncharacterized protein n=1 Tax=Staurois parvus TaxID=386267 RepID=A0ABN9CJK7_9NEOB|nr:unnamed protein product [Staurois parvus]